MPPTLERCTAYELRPGDRFGSTRALATEDPAVVASLEAPGGSSRYIRLTDGSRIRPRYVTKFWRQVRR